MASPYTALAQCSMSGPRRKRVATVDREHLTGDPRRLRSEQVPHAGRDVVHRAEPVQRHLGEIVRSHLLVGDERIGQLGRDESGPHRVHPHTGAPELVGRVADERLDARLRHRVRRHVRMGERAGDRRDGNDRASAGAREDRSGVLDREERAR